MELPKRFQLNSNVMARLTRQVRSPARRHGTIMVFAAVSGVILGSGFAFGMLMWGSGATCTALGPREVTQQSSSHRSIAAAPSDCEGQGSRVLRSRIARSAVRDALIDGTAGGSARMVPRVRDGRVDGVKLYSIFPGSVLDLAGLRNGDVVLRIQGISITSREAALGVYRELANQIPQTLTADLLRRGCPTTVVVSLEL